MILKTLSHKSTSERSIQKLIDYVFKSDKLKDKIENRSPLIFKKNINGYNPKKWAIQFKKNDDSRSYNYLKSRTVLRHEIVSFSNLDNPRISENTLSTIANWYLKNRSSKSLIVGAVHWESSIHLHFIVSGVGVDSCSTRIDRKSFNDFKKRFQEFQKSHFPELEHSIVKFSRSKDSKKN